MSPACWSHTNRAQGRFRVVRPRQTWTSFEGITDALPRTFHPHCASFHSLCPLTHSHTFNSGLWCSLRTVSLSSGSEVNLQITWGKTRSLSFSTQLLGTSLYTRVTNMVRHGVCLHAHFSLCPSLPSLTLEPQWSFPNTNKTNADKNLSYLLVELKIKSKSSSQTFANWSCPLFDLHVLPHFPPLIFLTYTSSSFCLVAFELAV